MKNILPKTILVFFGLLICLASFFLLFTRSELVNHNQPEKFSLQKTVDKNAAIPVIDTINARNSQINNISCNLKTVAQTPGHRAARLSGFLSYEKDRKFRMQLDSFLGPELDIGSDGTRFWFWSARMKKPALYWATYDNLTKTGLKTPFNPLWLSSCLGIDKIDYANATVDQSSNRWRIIRNTTNAKGEPVIAVTYVDPNKMLITGHGIYTSGGLLEASSEIQEFNGILPSKITFVWHTEGASMVWYLNDVKANSPIDPRMWLMPNLTPKIDMSRE